MSIHLSKVEEAQLYFPVRRIGQRLCSQDTIFSKPSIILVVLGRKRRFWGVHHLKPHLGRAVHLFIGKENQTGDQRGLEVSAYTTASSNVVCRPESVALPHLLRLHNRMVNSSDTRNWEIGTSQSIHEKSGGWSDVIGDLSGWFH